jgi:hypothetical protein
MSLITTYSDEGPPQQRERAPLRLLRGSKDAAAGPSSQRGGSRPTLRLIEDRSRILVAGADATRRAEILQGLAATLPPDTPFQEAGAVAEILEQAPRSGVVMLAGEIDDISADSLMELLGHRHPRLPVISLRDPEPRMVAAEAGR